MIAAMIFELAGLVRWSDRVTCTDFYNFMKDKSIFMVNEVFVSVADFQIKINTLCIDFDAT